MAEANRAWGWWRRNRVVMLADVVDRGWRRLQILGRQSGVQAGKVLRGEEVKLAAGGRDSQRGDQLSRHFFFLCEGIFVMWCDDRDVVGLSLVGCR